MPAWLRSVRSAPGWLICRMEPVGGGRRWRGWIGVASGGGCRPGRWALACGRWPGSRRRCQLVGPNRAVTWRSRLGWETIRMPGRWKPGRRPVQRPRSRSPCGFGCRSAWDGEADQVHRGRGRGAVGVQAEPHGADPQPRTPPSRYRAQASACRRHRHLVARFSNVGSMTVRSGSRGSHPEIISRGSLRGRPLLD